MPQRPPVTKAIYNQSLMGVFGGLGTAGGVEVFFLQTTIAPADLQKTTLISDIAGSEKWPVRDLFQREVDVQRVTSGLLPYFQDNTRVKFFNPLTLTVLPMNAENNEVLGKMPSIKEVSFEENGDAWQGLEFEKFYRFRHISGAPEYARLEWNDTSTKLVAIDGQHRLSALKRFLADKDSGGPRSDFLNWSIPVVVVAFRSKDGKGQSRNILEVVRNIFIYINSEARVPNRSRQILLTDESVNAVCTQELIQFSHDNDLLPLETRNEAIVPLLFFDWRGEEDEGRRRASPASLKSVEEIYDWFASYLVGDDFSVEQENALRIQPIDPLKKAFKERRVSAELLGDLREVVRERLLPGVVYLLQNFEPYRKYVAGLRKLEQEYDKKSDLARHAFYQLRFGTNRAGEDLQPSIREIYKELVDKIESDLHRRSLSELIRLDIGMRGVVSAFGQLREHLQAIRDKSVSWLDYAEWFTKHLNAAYKDGWFDISEKSPKKQLLTHIVVDTSGAVVNYRLDAAKDALGAFVAVVVSTYGRSGEDQSERSEKLRSELRLALLNDRLFSTLLRGYKKQVRPQLKEKYPQGGRPLTDAVKKEAESKTNSHIGKIEKALGAIKN